MRPCSNAADDLTNADALCREGVGDERAVATPWNGLCAHERDLLAACEGDAPVQASPERLGLHVVGISAEARVPPPGVYRILPRMPQPAKVGQMNVPDVAFMKYSRKIFSVELRISPGLGNGAHVRDLLHSVSREQVEELLDGVSRVADRENRGTH